MEGLQTDILLVIILYITLIYEILDGIRRKNFQPIKGNHLHSVGRKLAHETQHKPRNILFREDGEVQPSYHDRVYARKESSKRHFVQMRLIGRG